MFSQRRLHVLFDILADKPLHRGCRLPSGNANHRLALRRAMVNVHQINNDCRHCNTVSVSMRKKNRL